MLAIREIVDFMIKICGVHTFVGLYRTMFTFFKRRMKKRYISSHNLSLDLIRELVILGLNCK